MHFPCFYLFYFVCTLPLTILSEMINSAYLTLISIIHISTGFWKSKMCNFAPLEFRVKFHIFLNVFLIWAFCKVLRCFDQFPKIYEVIKFSVRCKWGHTHECRKYFILTFLCIFCCWFYLERAQYKVLWCFFTIFHKLMHLRSFEWRHSHEWKYIHWYTDLQSHFRSAKYTVFNSGHNNFEWSPCSVDKKQKRGNCGS